MRMGLLPVKTAERWGECRDSLFAKFRSNLEQMQKISIRAFTDLAAREAWAVPRPAADRTENRD
jgi:hypothetical protein